MKTSPQGIAFIKSFEGLFLTPYLCPAGYLTIGYGHVIKDHETLDQITDLQAQEILINDLKIFEVRVLNLTNIELTQNQFDALVSFVFNVGAAAYQRSTLRSKLNRGEERELIAKEFMRWIYVRGKIMRGLVRRRCCEAEMFMN